MTVPERMGVNWVLWVVGWALLVGGGVFVVPAYFLFGPSTAVWVSGAVLALSLSLGWLGVEAGRAVNAAAERPPEPGLGESVAPRELS